MTLERFDRRDFIGAGSGAVATAAAASALRAGAQSSTDLCYFTATELVNAAGQHS